MSEFAISALVRRRREITCDIDGLLSQIDALTQDVAAIDHVLRLFQPDMDTEAIPSLAFRPQPDWAKPGEVARMVLNELRIAGRPMSTGELTECVALSRGIENDPINRKRVYKVLDRQRLRGNLDTTHIYGTLHWLVAQR